MPETILLIDYENVKDTGLKDLPPHDRVLLFVGKGQKPKLGFIDGVLERTARLDMIPVAEQGRNNLDFYIAFYLGKMQSEAPGAHFIVLSRDQDLDPLLRQMGKAAMSCERREPAAGGRTVKKAAPPATRPTSVRTALPIKPVARQAAAPKAAPARPPAPKPVAAKPVVARPALAKSPTWQEDMDDAVAFLRKSGKRRPTTQKKLVNSLASHLDLPPQEVELLVKDIMREGFLMISNGAVTYKL